MEKLHLFFERQVDAHPENIALICNASTLTYEELEHRANQIAHFLKSSGIGHGAIVGLLLHRSVDLYATMLAILKVGAIYVPIDTSYPVERIDYMLKDANARTLITSKQFAKDLKLLHCQMIDLDQEEEKISLVPNSRITSNSAKSNEDLCYIIFTSGSTGHPKGVAVSHRSVCKFVESAVHVYGVTQQDRIYQGFSIAFDASIEEIWLTFSIGATLVVAAAAAVHAGASLVDFLNLYQVTVFSTVPTFLTMLDGEIPSLRLLILGGEVCPSDLVTRLSRPGLTIFNTYGPTEATVVTTFSICDPEKPVMIGKPLPHCEVYILDANLQPVPPSEVGELYIGGEGVAQGYLNRPELNQKKFITHPTYPSKRMYRTGDLVRLMDNDELEYVGRADEQVKLRGYRIELSEIENVILDYPDIQSTAVALQELTPGVSSLVAYLVAKKNKTIDIDKLITFIQTRLPEYMVPSLFELIDAIPLLPSGKVDRKSLPLPHMHHDRIKKGYIAPRTNLEKQICSIWEELFQHFPISIDANFFHDLGGHSLLAAKMISVLRRHPGMEHASTLDLYENPTIIKLAQALIANAKIAAQHTTELSQAHKQESIQKQNLRYFFCGLLQSVGCYLQFALSAWPVLLLFLVLISTLHAAGIFSLEFFLSLGIIIVGLNPVMFMIAILSKWILVGRIKPGHYRLWGWFYCRWWLAQQLEGITASQYLIGSPLMNIYYRLMGAKIGKNCYIATELMGCFDVITIGDNTSIGADSELLGYKVENGWLKIGNVTIGNNCFVGANAVLSINTELGDGSRLDDQSLLPANTSIPAGQSYLGSPARPGKVILPDIKSPEVQSGHKQVQEDGVHIGNTKLIVLHILSLHLLLFTYILSVVPGIVLVDYFYFKAEYLKSLLTAPLGGIFFILVIALSTLLVKKIFVGTVKPGLYRLDGWYYLRKWIVDRYMDLSLSAIETLYATMYIAPWFRALGAKVGKRAEISTTTHTSPDLLTIGDESFIADAVNLGAPRVYGGYALIGSVSVGKRTFIGNSALIPVNTMLGDHCLIGCLSVPPASITKINSNTSWFGSPAVFLHKREIFESFAEEATYKPTFKMLCTRAIIDLLKIVSTPSAFFFMLTLQFLSIDFLYRTLAFSIWTTIALFPLFDVAILLGVVGGVIGLKWILMGRFKEMVKPAWSLYVWLNEWITGLYDSLMCTTVLDAFTGTPFLPFMLRLLGAKIGRRNFIDTTSFTEYDLVEIGNDVAINTGSTIQTHLFEDQVLKMGKIKIEDGCTVGSSAIVLYHTLMEKNSTLANLSLLMKGEILPANSYWIGIPAQHISRYIADKAK